MSDPARIDLHTHSTASDGTLTPPELVRAAAGAGLDVVALTDHDTTAGWAPAVAALPPGLTLIRGAEISCRWFGVEPAIPLHLLAYLFDPAEPELAAELARVRQAREERGERIVRLLQADGIQVSWTEILAGADGGTVGRPHIAQALIRAGLVATTSEAFGPDWLGERYRLPKDDIEVFRAVALVRAAGGVPVFAHPRASRRGRIVPDELIADLAAAGLAGLEADHEDHDAAEREHVRRLAAELGLLVTGSSDFHGTHKTVRLGAHTTGPEAYERIVALARGVTPVASS
ncbi:MULTISPECIES: PHP domain-containing protein [Micromonospora]|uniref:PHP domain-containing protein n=1 Tax=Micromonospora TaxID=1873 RepID=UPI0003EEC934|nr:MULTISPECIES: PHP domain-containing protein [unclassified Micromonospora]EWM66123.1 PHP protein [Micromonospora sp. M42]MCK1807840.1 PHP domain-containing protein [Micromonospora sp. R42106]MCK1832453.1 PHP domain-containing protein [Micromonospora sp. R42003]MCK1843813.1 PHP domain-containing protein [Micromonospora sp. R42004]MCM1017002.1 PHP domain-containing protein [Micromonospora sp. XM-20-01]